MSATVMIRIKPKTRKELAGLCNKKGMTYNDAIIQLLKEKKQANCPGAAIPQDSATAFAASEDESK